MSRERVIAAARMLAHFGDFFHGEFAGLVEDRDRNEGLVDVVQQRRARQPALIILAHAEMLRIRHRKAGDEQAVAIGFVVMAADRGQPLPQ